jgi:hypothetical protein
MIAPVRLRGSLVRVPVLALALTALAAAVAVAGPVTFLIDSQPVGLGRHVLIDFNPSKLTSRAETPDSIAFFLPSRWQVDHRAAARECTPAQAAQTKCPTASRIGIGHAVIHVSGYLFPGGQTDGVAYVIPYLGRPAAPGDPASIVLQVQLLGLDPLINAANQYLSTKIKKKYSITGRIIPLRSGQYGYEASFSQMPGGFRVPPPLAAAGVSVTITRFKLEVGAVRRVRKPTVDVIHTRGANGKPRTVRIRDHVLIGYHLLKRAKACPGSGLWPWQIQVGFPEGTQTITGTVKCG